MFWGVASDLGAKDGAPSGFQATLGPHRVLIPQVVGCIRRLSKSGEQEMRIRLNPPELGAMRIRIRVAGEGVKANLLVERPQAQTLLEEGVPALMRALQEQGLKVDSLSVEVGHGSDDPRFSSQSDGQGGERGQGGFPSSQLWPELIEETILPTAAELLSSTLLDVVA
ncbi:MAG: flagellar hook-length control protein FliK [Candidatus Coatesbacteria bacterium]|nr:flagellar hook-length control protein FliK [Candidatus Coatesbacteria bacterium]